MIILLLFFYVIFFSILFFHTVIYNANFDFLFKFRFFILKIYGSLLRIDQLYAIWILRDEKYFSNFTLAQSNVHTISGPVNLIKGSSKATIILPKGTKLQIEDALYSNKSSRNLLSFKNIR